MDSYLKKDHEGITLIALVVTIIILLILAGISVSVLTGDNGIIKQAGNAKKESKIMELKEKLEMKMIKAEKKNANTDTNTNTNTNTNTTITEEEIREEFSGVEYQIWSVKAKNGEIIRIDFNENDSYIIYDGKMEENTEFENANGIKYRKFEIYEKSQSPRSKI